MGTITSFPIETVPFSLGAHPHELLSPSVASGELQIDTAGDAIYDLTLTNTQTAITIVPRADSKAHQLTIILRQGSGLNRVNWAGVIWAAGRAPELNTGAGGFDIVRLVVTQAGAVGSVYAISSDEDAASVERDLYYSGAAETESLLVPTRATERPLIGANPFTDDIARWSYATAVSEAQALALLPNVAIDTVGQSAAGNTIYALRIADDGAKPIVLVTNGIHGNEFDAAPAVNEYAHRVAISTDEPYASLRAHYALFVVVTVNPDGIIANQRENANAVNLNRNWPFYWEESSDADKGASASSEAETQAIQAWIASRADRLAMTLDLHGWESRQVWGMLSENHHYTEQCETLQRAVYLYTKHAVDARDYTGRTVIYETPRMLEYLSHSKPYLYTYMRAIGAPFGWAGIIEYPVGETIGVICTTILDSLTGLSLAALDREAALVRAAAVSPALEAINNNHLLDSYSAVEGRPNWTRTTRIGCEQLIGEGPGGRDAVRLTQIIEPTEWMQEQAECAYATAASGYVLIAGELGNGTDIAAANMELFAGGFASLPDYPAVAVFAAAAADGDLVYVYGGYSGVYLDSIYVIDVSDPATASWSLVGTLSQGRQRHTMEFYNGELIIIGGRTSAGYADDVLAYRLSDGAERVVGTLNTARGWHATAVAGDTLYVIGGWTGTTVLSSVETLALNVADPTQVATVSGLALSAPRRQMAHATYGDKTLIYGGNDGTSRKDTIEILDHTAATLSPFSYTMRPLDGEDYTNIAPKPAIDDAALIAADENYWLIVGGRADAGGNLNIYIIDEDEAEVGIRSKDNASYGYMRASQVFTVTPGERLALVALMRRGSPISTEAMPYARLYLRTGTLAAPIRKERIWYAMPPEDWSLSALPITIEDGESELRAYVRIYGQGLPVDIAGFALIRTGLANAMPSAADAAVTLTAQGTPLALNTDNFIQGAFSPVWGADQGADLTALSFTTGAGTTGIENVRLRYSSDYVSGQALVPNGQWTFEATINDQSVSATADAGALNNRNYTRYWRRDVVRWQLSATRSNHLALTLSLYGFQAYLVLSTAAAEGSIDGWIANGNGIIAATGVLPD